MDVERTFAICQLDQGDLETLIPIDQLGANLLIQDVVGSRVSRARPSVFSLRIMEGGARS